MTKLHLSGATVGSDQGTTLGPITLELELASITAVLGPNGAGKSLFLALCHGTLPSTSREVNWDGATARDTRRDRGYMLQTSVVLRRTVAANIDFALASHGVGASERPAKVSRALAQARLESHANAPAASLSGGELRRMNLARALVTKPRILLLDEPFAGLDPSASQAMESIITQVALGTPILMANHDLVQTRRMAERVLFFSKGLLQENALASDFFSNPKTAEGKSFLQGQLL